MEDMFKKPEKMSSLIKLIEDRKFEKKFYSSYKRLKIKGATIQGIAANSNLLFIADNRSEYLSVFDKEGNFIKFSKPQNVYLKNNYPFSINFSDVSANEDNVVASDRHNHSIYKYDCEGNLVDIVNSHTSTERIEIDKDSKIFFVKSGNSSPSVYLLSEKENISKGSARNIALDPMGNLYGNDYENIFRLPDKTSEQFKPLEDKKSIIDIAFSKLYFFVSSRGIIDDKYINIFMREKTPILLDSYKLNTKESNNVNLALVGDNLYVQKGFRSVTKFNILKDDYLLKLEARKEAIQS